MIVCQPLFNSRLVAISLWSLDFGVGVFHDDFPHICMNFGGNKLVNAGTNFDPLNRSIILAVWEMRKDFDLSNRSTEPMNFG